MHIKSAVEVGAPFFNFSRK